MIHVWIILFVPLDLPSLLILSRSDLFFLPFIFCHSQFAHQMFLDVLPISISVCSPVFNFQSPEKPCLLAYLFPVSSLPQPAFKPIIATSCLLNWILIFLCFPMCLLPMCGTYCLWLSLCLSTHLSLSMIVQFVYEKFLNCTNLLLCALALQSLLPVLRGKEETVNSSPVIYLIIPLCKYTSLFYTSYQIVSSPSSPDLCFTNLPASSSWLPLIC